MRLRTGFVGRIGSIRMVVIWVLAYSGKCLNFSFGMQVIWMVEWFLFIALLGLFFIQDLNLGCHICLLFTDGLGVGTLSFALISCIIMRFIYSVKVVLTHMPSAYLPPP